MRERTNGWVRIEEKDVKQSKSTQVAFFSPFDIIFKFAAEECEIWIEEYILEADRKEGERCTGKLTWYFSE